MADKDDVFPQALHPSTMASYGDIYSHQGHSITHFPAWQARKMMA